MRVRLFALWSHLLVLGCQAAPPVVAPTQVEGSAGGSSGGSTAKPANIVAASSSSGAPEGQELVDLRGDATWRVSSAEATGWTDLGFDDSAWAAPGSPAPEHCGWMYTPGTIGRPHESWEHPGTATFWDTALSTVLYARKRFIVDATAQVTFAALTSIADDDHDVFLNGVLIASEASTTSGPVLQTDMRAYLTSGENILAVRGYNTGGCAWLLMDGVILGKRH